MVSEQGAVEEVLVIFSQRSDIIMSLNNFIPSPRSCFLQWSMNCEEQTFVQTFGHVVEGKRGSFYQK